MSPEGYGESRDLAGTDDRPWIWDINGDGFLDIGGMSDESRAPVILNQEGKRFAPLAGVTFQPLAHPHEILDLNGDGYLDVDGGYRGQWLFLPEDEKFRHVKTPRFDHLAHVPDDVRHTLVALKDRELGDHCRPEQEPTR